MGRVNFREVRDRFTHIDAEFVACTLGFGETEPKYAVKFYPWWEHPAHVEAVKEKKPWGFADYREGAREVTVYPLGLAEFRVSCHSEVIDWSFHETHPLLWPYEDSGEIFCNSDPPLEEVVRRVMAALPRVPKGDIYSYLDPLLPFKAPFCLGTFPFSLFGVVEETLAELRVDAFIPRRPQPKTLPVLLLIDGSDYIIADDFEIDVPRFEHRPEWCKPARIP